MEELKPSPRPSTPGDLLAGLLEGRAMSQSECARRLGVSRRRVIALIKGRRFSPATARRLAEVFGVDAEVWLAMQRHVEAWDALYGEARADEDIELRQDRADDA